MKILGKQIIKCSVQEEVCDMCTEMFEGKSLLKEHKEKMHESRNKNKCVSCDFTSTNEIMSSLLVVR